MCTATQPPLHSDVTRLSIVSIHVVMGPPAAVVCFVHCDSLHLRPGGKTTLQLNKMLNLFLFACLSCSTGWMLATAGGWTVTATWRATATMCACLSTSGRSRASGGFCAAVFVQVFAQFACCKRNHGTRARGSRTMHDSHAQLLLNETPPTGLESLYSTRLSQALS